MSNRSTIELAADRQRIDAFHAHFNGVQVPRGDAATSEPTNGANIEQEAHACGGCGAVLDTTAALWCGSCRCAAYCNKQCQRTGWKAGCHKPMCQLLARARALPAADPSRRYVVQLSLMSKNILLYWGEDFRRLGRPDVADSVRALSDSLKTNERVLLALEARHHMFLRQERVPQSKKLGAPELALFLLQAILEPAVDVPTLNMPRNEPHRPYAIWIPAGPPVPRPMAEPVGKLLSRAGLPTSKWYVGGGLPAEAQRFASLLTPGSDGGLDDVDGTLNSLCTVNVDYYSEDDYDDDDDDLYGMEYGMEDKHQEEESKGEGTAAGVGVTAAAARPAPVRPGPGEPTRVLLVGGMHVFGARAGEGEDPLLTAVASSLRYTGARLDIDFYDKSGTKASQERLAQRLNGGGYASCVVLGLGAGDDFKPRNPTHPWGNGPWRDALTAWVRAGGVLVVHGERAAAAVMKSFFGLAWGMEGDWYRRTDHQLNTSNPLLGRLASRLPHAYNVKACMLSDVPPEQRVYSSAPGAASHSNVPFMAGVPVQPGMCAMAAAAVGAGAVVFFGDVNWEGPTMVAVAQLLQELVHTRERSAAA